MIIWFRTAASIPTPMELSNSGVAAVFYHLYKTMIDLGLPVVLDDPGVICVELWWGWDWPERNTENVLVCLTLGETSLEHMPYIDQFRDIFITTEFYKSVQSPRENLHVWRLGVDPLMFSVIEHHNEHFTFSHIGNMQKRKGSDIMCAAFVDEFGGSDNVRLELRLPGIDHTLHDELIGMYNNYNNIEFIMEVYSRAETWRHYTGDCLLMPSLREGWGLCLTEAMSTGMSAIVSALPVFGELFRDSCGWWIEMSKSVLGFGFGVPEKKSLRVVMRYAYEHPEEVCARGKTASEFVRDNLTWEKGIRDGFIPVALEKGWL